MQTRPLGKTGLTVTPLGLGLAALGRPGYINLGHAQDLSENYDPETMQAQTSAVLEAAWNAGIRYFDAARSYGRAEEFLANWLAQHGVATGSVTVGSKWGYFYTAGWQVHADKHEIKDHSLPLLKRQLQESRDLLGAHLRLYQIHSATLESGVLDDQAVLDELAEQRNHDLIIGLSVSGPRQTDAINKALEIRRDGIPLFGTVQATWNLLERSATTALEAAHEAGLGVIIKEALANGRLTPRNQDAGFQRKRHEFDEVALEKQTTMDAVALAAVLAQPWVDVVLSGAATLSQLHANLAALTLWWSPELEARFESFTEAPADYWGKRTLLAWN